LDIWSLFLHDIASRMKSRMKSRRYVFLTLVAVHIFIYSDAQDFVVSDSITAYHQLSDEEDFVAAANLAFKIANYYIDSADLAIAKKYYDFAAISANKASQDVLEARAVFKVGMTEKRMYESGAYSMEEETQYKDDCIKSFKRAHLLFKKSKLSGSYEDVMAMLNGGEVQFIVGDYKNSSSALQTALKNAQKNRYEDLALNASKLLAQNYAELDDEANESYYNSIYKNYQEFFISKDSLAQSIGAIEKLETTNQSQKTELELNKTEIKNKNLELENQNAIVEKNQAIIKQQELQSRLMVGGIGVILIFLVIAVIANQYKRKTNKKLETQNKQILKQKSLIESRQKELSEEKARTDALLLNILPAPVADELRKNKKVVPRYYKMVTVMFTDFKGFTKIASDMSPGEIVKELDACFVAFDQIIEKYENLVGRKGIEKIKTIGDGYMCAGGVPIENESNPLDMVRVALAIKDYMAKRKIEKSARNEPCFEIRIGINTGPVVAGVVGKKKFAYDIWGDAVNLASRMETSGEEGRVNISEQTYQYVKDHFFFTHRGKINAKNKGNVDMYFVDGRIKYTKQNKEYSH
jgi:adenylate cyclase